MQPSRQRWGDVRRASPASLGAFSGKLSPSPLRVRNSQSTGTRVDGGTHGIALGTRDGGTHHRYSAHPSPGRQPTLTRPRQSAHVIRSNVLSSRAQDLVEERHYSIPGNRLQATAPALRRGSLAAVKRSMRSDVLLRASVPINGDALRWQTTPLNKGRTSQVLHPVSPTSRRLERATYPG